MNTGKPLFAQIMGHFIINGRTDLFANRRVEVTPRLRESAH